ncbi:MAG: Hsp20/alpha crystallin family protein [Cyanobacteria bacterium P01_A01_bin.135]
MEVIRRQLDQVFDELAATDSNNVLTSMWTPPAELLDDGDHFTLKLQVPGIKPTDLDVQASREAVAVAGDFRPEPRSEGGSDRSEFRYGKFRRVIALPETIQNGRISADYRDGILWLTLPKTVEAIDQVVRVPLHGADNEAIAGTHISEMPAVPNDEHAGGNSAQ